MQGAQRSVHRHGAKAGGTDLACPPSLVEKGTAGGRGGVSGAAVSRSRRW